MKYAHFVWLIGFVCNFAMSSDPQPIKQACPLSMITLTPPDSSSSIVLIVVNDGSKSEHKNPCYQSPIIQNWSTPKVKRVLNVTPESRRAQRQALGEKKMMYHWQLNSGRIFECMDITRWVYEGPKEP